VHHLLAILSKVHDIVQYSVFSSRSAGFVIFALGAPLFCDFQQSARVCAKQRFQSEIGTFCHFRTGPTIFLRFLAKCTGLFKTAFSARVQKVLRLLHFADHFLAIFSKVHEFVKFNVCDPRNARFVIFAVGALLLSEFQESAQVSTTAFLTRE